MNGNIQELRDYLGLYKVLIEGKYYDPRHSEDAKELLELINKLDDSNNLKDFDFKLLKRKVSKLFHPDIYTSFDTDKLGYDTPPVAMMTDLA